MSGTRRRQSFGRILLALYATLLLAMSVHVHGDRSVWSADSCYECANNMPHSGHLTSAAQLMHDCVLCQLQSAVYVVPLAITLLLPLRSCSRRVDEVEKQYVQQGLGIRLSRAPPFACF
ncbi:MAG: hypothetical protein K6A96_07135 [Prevotella sp.]|nr:hypothetical protein [Prevotella sp.]